MFRVFWVFIFAPLIFAGAIIELESHSLASTPSIHKAQFHVKENEVLLGLHKLCPLCRPWEYKIIPAINMTSGRQETLTYLWAGLWPFMREGQSGLGKRYVARCLEVISGRAPPVDEPNPNRRRRSYCQILRANAFDADVRSLANLGVLNLLPHYVPLLDIYQRLPQHDYKQKGVDGDLHLFSAGYAQPSSIGLVLSGFGLLYWAFWLLYVRVLSSDGGGGWRANVRAVPFGFSAGEYS